MVVRMDDVCVQEEGEKSAWVWSRSDDDNVTKLREEKEDEEEEEEEKKSLVLVATGIGCMM